MTDPLAKYVRGDGTTKYYDTDAMAADVRRMLPVVDAAVAMCDLDDRMTDQVKRVNNRTIKAFRAESALALNDAVDRIVDAVRRYREVA